MHAPLALSVLGLAVLSGCGGSSNTAPGAVTDDEEEAKAKGLCTITDVSGGGLKSADIVKINDPVAKLILQGTGTCPKTTAAVVARLRVTDKNQCADDPKGGPAGTRVRFVSETSQVLGKPDSYRAVVTRQCDGRPVHGLFLSIFGMGATDTALPDNVELIGVDPVTGMFNYYELANGKWSFFGNSQTLIKDGYTCDPAGFCTSKAAEKTRCANCHPGGGLQMKELNSPWTHWEGDTTTPGASDLATKLATFVGTKSDGIELEGTVMGGNRAWNPKRTAFLKDNVSLADLLKPLFCTLEVNLQGSSTSGGASSMTRVRSDFFFDPAWSRSDSFDVTSADYSALLAANGQKIVNGSNKQLTGPDGKPVLDTFFPFTFVERSANDADFVANLVKAGVLDDEFVKDALIIDFTRPVFSPARCDLLDAAPEVVAASRTPEAIRTAWIAKLNAAKPAAGSVAAQFLTNLQTPSQTAAHSAKIDVFVAACKKRPSKELLADVLKVGSQRRDTARLMPMMEFPEALAFDNLNVKPTAVLDPVTCVLTGN